MVKYQGESQCNTYVLENGTKISFSVHTMAHSEQQVSRTAHLTQLGLFPPCWLSGCTGGPAPRGNLSLKEGAREPESLSPMESLMSKISGW